MEIGAVEILNHVPTGRTVPVPSQLERSIPTDAFGVHGLSAAFLADKPRFAEIADGLLEFLADLSSLSTTPLSTSDFNFELRRLGRDEICSERTIDTVQMARRKYPGAPPAWMRYAGDIRSISRIELCMVLKDAHCVRVYLELREVASPGYLSSRRQRDDFLV